jgi:MoaA/NifB/PqqE/SkfB family radical SAM enzyme
LVLKYISLELTTRCNFRCIHCYQNDKTKSLNRSLALDIVNKAISLGHGWLILTGGEALLFDHFQETYRLARYSGIPVNLFSNGLLLKPFLEKEQLPPNFIEISIYGFSSKAYLDITGTNAFTEILKSIELIAHKGINYKLKYVLMKQNSSDLGSFLEFCSREKHPFSINPALLPTGADFRITPEEIVKYEEKYPGIYLFKNIELGNTCTIGEDIFIGSDGYIRGCPVMPPFCNADSILDPSDFYRIAHELENDINSVHHSFCPAWELREKPSEIARFSLGRKQ